MQNVLTAFVTEMLTHKDLRAVEPATVDQLTVDLVETINTQINRAIIAKLSTASLEDFGSLIDKKANTRQIEKFFKGNKVNTTNVATEVMQTFRQGYIGA